MEYMDFFKNPTESGSSVFDVDEEHLNLSKEAFLENQKVAELLK